MSNVNRLNFRSAMARLGAAVNVITSEGPGGRAGFTASAVCSVTDSPPTLLVCLNRSASVHAAFAANQVLCVNTLSHDDEHLSTIFGGTTSMEERFASGDWSTLETGAPVLAGAIVSFDCVVTQTLSAGTHDIMICDVVALREGDATAGLVYFGRRYHRVG